MSSRRGFAPTKPGNHTFMFQIGDTINTRFWRATDVDPTGGRLRDQVDAHAEQLELIVAKYTRHWATGGRTNITEAERGIHNLYDVIGLPPPKKIVWFDSPAGALLTAALLFWRDHRNDEELRHPPSREEMSGYLGPTFLLPHIRRAFNIPSNTELDFLCSHIERRFIFDAEVPIAVATVGLVEQARDEMRDQLSNVSYPIDAWLDLWMDVEEQLVDTPLEEMWNKLGSDLWVLQDNEQSDILWDLASDLFLGLQRVGLRGPSDALACAIYECMAETGVEVPRTLDALVLCVVAGASFWPLADICIAYKRPVELHVNENLQLHRNDGLAIRFADGWGMYALGGLPVSERIAHGRFTLQDIEKQFNVEMRRVMIDRFGVANYLLGSGCQIKHRDKFGTLYHKQMGWEDEPIQMVEVQNSTPERDGSFKRYFLRVPPDMETARQAVAWTFGLSEHEYKPTEES